MEDVTWGNYDDSNNILGDICFTCVELCGRLRPGLDADQCLSLYKSGDEKLAADFEAGLQAMGDEDIVGQFQPASSVDHDQSYTFSVFQDYGLLTESEFCRVCKMTPQEAGFGATKNKKPALTLGLFGPKSKEKYYPVGLQGVSVDELFGMRKIRVEFRDTVTCLLKDVEGRCWVVARLETSEKSDRNGSTM